MINMVDFAHKVCGITPKHITYPVQCSCGHLYLEKYQINLPEKGNPVGFCWCGFCRTRLNIYEDNRFEEIKSSNAE